MNPTTRNTLKFALIAALIGGSFVAHADTAQPGKSPGKAIDPCYGQTLEIEAGIDPEKLSVAPCNQALHFRGLSREGRSITLHNRGLIEWAKGDLDAARASLERAVKLARTVDMRHLALAQLAAEQGDHRAALERFDELIVAAERSADSVMDQRRLVEARDKALRALGEPDRGQLLGHAEEQIER